MFFFHFLINFTNITQYMSTHIYFLIVIILFCYYTILYYYTILLLYYSVPIYIVRPASKVDHSEMSQDEYAGSRYSIRELTHNIIQYKKYSQTSSIEDSLRKWQPLYNDTSNIPKIVCAIHFQLPKWVQPPYKGQNGWSVPKCPLLWSSTVITICSKSLLYINYSVILVQVVTQLSSVTCDLCSRANTLTIKANYHRNDRTLDK